VEAPKSPDDAAESTRRWWKCPGIVYFVAAGTPPVAVKIGMAAQTGQNTLRSSVIRRLSQIQSSNHELIELLGVIYLTDGEYPTREAERIERELHTEFEHDRRFKEYGRGAEWFNASETLLAKVKAIASAPESLGLPKNFSEAR